MCNLLLINVKTIAENITNSINTQLGLHKDFADDATKNVIALGIIKFDINKHNYSNVIT